MSADAAPRANLIRAVPPGSSLLRAADDNAAPDPSAPPTLFGHFARFDEPTEIDSMFEGHFVERIAKGAFRKTMREGRDKMRVLFQHGMDPSVGDKPIADVQELREDDEGAYYEATLFRGLPELIMDGLRAGVYGASFRFSVLRETWDNNPEPSDANPRGLPERTIKEASVPEFGPVTFPAYPTASAGVRSLTDSFLLRAIASDPDAVRMMVDEYAEDRAVGTTDVPATPAPADDGPERATVAENSNLCGPDKPHAVMDGSNLVACYATVAEAQAAADGSTGTNSETPDGALRAAGQPDAAAPPADEAERRSGQPDAPSQDDADPEGVTSTDERRDTPAPALRGRTPIYGTRRSERNKTWLLAPSRSTKRS